MCGRWLGKFTLWHQLLLHAFDSPFTARDPEARATPEDLLRALEICRTQWPGRPRPRATVRDWWWLVRMGRSEDRFHWQARTFVGWIEAHEHGPEFWKDNNREGGGVTAPEVMSLAYGLTAKAGLSEHAAWAKSPGEALTILGTVAELEGSELSFVDEAELAEDDAILGEGFKTAEAIYERARQDLGEEAARRLAEDFRREHGGGNGRN